MSNIVVKKYKGERKLTRGLEKMAAKGYIVQTHNTRKQVFRLLTGLFTKRQIHTVTYVKGAPSA